MKNNKISVLIVDDTLANIDLLRNVLEKDYVVKVATSGALAIKVANTMPDIILLDIMMPDMDGYEVCSILKGNKKTKDIPIIFVTAMNDHLNEEKGLSLGAVDYITKPISPSIVKLRVKNQILLNNHNKMLQNKVFEKTMEIVNLNTEIEDTQKEVVFRMGSIAETRSKETGDHVKRVADYSKHFAKLYGLPESESELLKMASPMHDIGKVGIPDYILNKNGKLTFDEFEIMKTHTTLGYDMLNGSDRSILKAAAVISITHHEKWDGSGYPNNISGDNIHIFGRITAIADVFDALGSERCYKKAWKDEDIFKLLKDQRSMHFDPDLVDLFFENLNSFLSIRETYKINH